MEFHMHNDIIKKLFYDRECLRMPGFTRIMIDTIKRPRTYIIRGVAKTVGTAVGPSEALLNATFGRMQKFSTLVTAVLAAEFPAFDLLASFRAFSLSNQKRVEAGAGLAATADLREDRQTCLKRLAQCLNLNEPLLCSEFEAHAPYALAYFRSNECSNHEAWATALRQLQKSRKQNADTLRAVLCRYAAWVSSSADTERTFSRTSGRRMGQSEDGNVKREEDIVQLQMDPLCTSAQARLTTDAAAIWRRSYGKPRVHLKPRIDRGVKRKQDHESNGEAGFLKRLKSAHRVLAADTTVTPMPDREPVLHADHAARHQKELQFNIAKLQTARVEAAIAGHLLPGEVSDGLVESAKDHIKTLCVNQRRRLTENKRHCMRFKKPELDLANKTVYFAAGTAVPLGRGMTRTGNTSDADVIVVDDPAKAPEEVIIVAGLIGAMVATRAFVETAGATGAALAFRHAISIARSFHMSDKFMFENEDLAGDILAALGRGDCKWKMVTFVQLCDLAARRKAREVFALVANDELEDFNFLQNVANRRTAVANDFVCKLNLDACRTGVCTNH